MRHAFLALFFLLCAFTLRAAETLEVYFVDVEGGQATLLVSPAGESMLVDAGWPGYGGRDADRIVAAAKAAGVKQIDYLLVTHYHLDHVGGVPPLAAKIPVIHFVDHGASVETDKDANQLFSAYRQVRDRGQHSIVKPGDKIPIKGLDVEVVAAAGKLITAPLKGAGAPNPLCAATPLRAADPTENAQSVGIVIRFGKFRLANLADVTWNKELELVCPVNRIGTVDIYLSTHHGMNLSGSAAIVHALAPRVAIMNNGARKGGSPDAWQIVRNSPGLEDIWQLHYAVEAGKQNNTTEPFIANPEEKCQGYGLKLSASADGSFTVTNTRNGFARRYRGNR
jgi:beta-lactamase superfamily II metal-dependent hydrolase